MIEVVYKEDGREAKDIEDGFQLPRNIRQIGIANEDCKIYLEDYVYTFLKKITDHNEKEKNDGAQIAFLLGEIKWKDGIPHYFITGAILLDEKDFSWEHIDFSDNIWKEYEQEKEEYFADIEILGWFFTQSCISTNMTDYFLKIHGKYFGIDKIFVIMEPTEKEEAFYCDQNGNMLLQKGYYIYYEKNESMQRYMVEKKNIIFSENIEIIDDRATKKMRDIVKEKHREEDNSVLSYGITVCLAVAVLGVGANFYKKYTEMYQVREQVKEVSSVTWEEPKKELPEVAKKAATITPYFSITPSPTPELITVTPSPSILIENNLEKVEETNTTAYESDTYVIRPGDTLYEISLSQYGNVEMLEKICEKNKISEGEIIYPGQIIVLP